MGRSLSVPDANAGVSSIASAAGFSAGDYVYQQRTDTGTIPAAALPTGAFTYNNIPSQSMPMATSTTSSLNYVDINGGSTGGQIAAKLNNGNIVIVYTRNVPGTFVSTAYFRIVDPAGAIVVAETAASTAVVGGRYGVSVCVLPNNNFVMCWTTQNGTSANWNMSFRVYQENGTPVGAAVTNTTVLFTATTDGTGALLKIIPRSDNSFIMMGYTIWNVNFLSGSAAGFDATFNGGTGLYTRTLRATQQQNVDFAIRSDNTIHIFFQLTAGLVEYNVLSSTGALASSGTIASNSSVFCISCVLMPSGNVNVFVYGNETSTLCNILGYSWNGTTLTSIGRIVSFTTTSTPTTTFLDSYAQGGAGNFTLFWSHIDTSGALTYQTFNNSGVSVSGPIPRTIPAISYPAGQILNPAIFDVGSETRVYMPSRTLNSAGSNTSVWVNGARGSFYFSYDSTTYATTKISPVNINYGNVGSIPLGAYTKSASSPIEASFTVASTGTYIANVSAGTYLVGKTTVSGLSAAAVSAITLQNGNFAYCFQSGAVVYLKTFSPAGVELATTTVTTSASLVWSYCAMAPFSNGSFVVLYMSAANTLSYKIYNASLTELFAGNISTSFQILGPSTVPKVAAYGDGSQVAIVYRLSTASNFYQIQDLTSANVLTSVQTGTSQANNTNFQLVPYRASGFGFSYYEGDATSAEHYFRQYIKTGPTSWSVSGPVNIPNTSDVVPDLVFNSSVPAPANSPILISNYNSASTALINFPEPTFAASGIATSGGAPFNAFAVNLPSNITFASGVAHGIGYTGNGACVWAVGNYQVNDLRLKYFNARPLNVGNSSSFFIGTVYDTGINVAVNQNLSYISVCPLAESACVIAFIDDGFLPCFIIPNVQTTQASQTLTAGTDVSTSRLSLTPEGGYVLRGIALTAATAGGSGLVQTKGIASVSGSYQSITPTMNFDFRISTAAGARGSITGRTVTLEG